MARKPIPETLIKSIHRNVAPTWYGVVFAKDMQDPSITSEFKALIAVVATFPRENWTWRADHLRSLLNWGRERYQKVMREAKARQFVIVNQTSDGLSFHSEYQWNIEKPARLPKAGNPTTGKAVRREAGPYNDVVKGNDEVKSNEEKNRKHGVTDVMAPLTPFSREKERRDSPSRAVTVSSAGKSKAYPERSSRLPIPPECWERILQHVREELTEIEWRNLKRDRAALRSLWALTPSMDEHDSVQAICDALDEAASRDDTAEGIFSIATQILERDCNGTRSRDVEEYGRDRMPA